MWARHLALQKALLEEHLVPLANGTTVRGAKGRCGGWGGGVVVVVVTEDWHQRAQAPEPQGHSCLAGGCHAAPLAEAVEFKSPLLCHRPGRKRNLSASRHCQIKPPRLLSHSQTPGSGHKDRQTHLEERGGVEVWMDGWTGGGGGREGGMAAIL